MPVNEIERIIDGINAQLELLAGDLGGEATAGGLQEAASPDASVQLVLPSWKGEFSGIATAVSFSLPDDGKQLLAADDVDSSDNALQTAALSGQIDMDCRFDFAMTITHEQRGIVAKLRKTVGLDTEITTGDEDFDKKYLLHCEAESEEVASNFLAPPTVKATILKLEEFLSLALSPDGLQLVWPVTDQLDFSCAEIKRRLALLVDLCKAS